MYPIIILWAHPRSMSTAMERIMRERGDLTCFHEPFMYDYYVARKVREMPHFQAEEDHPVNYRDVRDSLLRAAEKGPVFVKDMSYYVFPHILEDTEFSERLTNTFLIRDPIASIPSYFKLDPELTSEEVGLKAQAQHYQALCETGPAPVVIQAEDIRADTKGMINALWDAIDLPRADHAFDWDSEKPKDWEQVGAWHGTASTSKGILPITPAQMMAQKEKFHALAQENPFLQELLEDHQPHYEMLRSKALKT